MLCLQRRVILLRHSATSFLDNLFWRPSCLSPAATRTTHLWVTTSFLSLNSKHDFCYIYSEAYPTQTTSQFNSAYLFWRPLFLTPKSTGLPTTGNMPKCLLNPFIPVFLLTMMTSTKANSQLKPLLNFLSKTLRHPRSSPLFSFKFYNEEAT